MPARAARLCGCGAVVQDGGACRSCAARRGRESDQHRPPARKRGYDTRWDKARRTYLGRHPYCEMCEAEGKQVLASVVDHRIPHRGDDKLFWDSGNWAALCVAHHSGDKQAMEATGRAPSATVTTRVELVCGPPGSGKSTWVTDHLQRGDLVVDMDTLFMALSGMAYYDKPAELLAIVRDARQRILQCLARPNTVRRAWVVTAAPRASDREKLARELNANVTVFALPASVCMRRILKDERRCGDPALWRKAVDDWWNKWQPRTGHEHIITGARIGARDGGGAVKVWEHAGEPAASPTREKILD